MKYAKILVPAYLLLPLFSWCQTGADCANAIPLTLDGVLKTFSTSSTTGNNVICSGVNSPITWFSFVTNASAECPLLNITAPSNADCEVALYTTCNNSGNQSSSGMCFSDGTGLWAPAETYTVAPNTKYYLRVKTATSGNISIAGQYNTPSNNSCTGAYSIGPDARSDNNACHKPPVGVTPQQLCALSLENTAFYQYYVASTGISIININSIICDNIGNANSNGFQVGFFTGDCSSLVPINCSEVYGSFVQATTRSLSAGTKVTVAIDGVGGSNCQYEITAINAYGVLAQGFKNFSVWEKVSSNVVKWTIENKEGAYYEIERSETGQTFSKIGTIHKYLNTKGEYSFEDFDLAAVTFYRVKQINQNGKILMSEIVKVIRKDLPDFKLNLINPVTTNLSLRIESAFPQKMLFNISSFTGQIVMQGFLNCSTGTTWFNKELPQLPDGKYLLTIMSNHQSWSKSFIKIH